jgi:hypothetical protein
MLPDENSQEKNEQGPDGKLWQNHDEKLTLL